MQATIIGIDIAKTVFQVCGVDAHRRVVFNRRLSRRQLEAFMLRWPASRVVMEACYMAHYWGRRFEAMGHRVQLIPAQHVKPFVRGNKNDRNDALAIVEAADRPGLRYVPVKTAEQQEILALHRLRERLKAQRIQLTNQTRGLLAEFGIVFAQGHAAFRRMLVTVDERASWSPRFQATLARVADEYRRISEQLQSVDADIAAFVDTTPACAVLMSIPGIGVVNASALVAAVDRGQAFANARQFAVWLGLTPKQSASGQRAVMGGISKRGDRYLRTQLIHGARAMLRWARHRDDALSRWANALVQRRGVHKATVAVAHRLARICWVLLQRNESFRLDPRR